MPRSYDRLLSPPSPLVRLVWLTVGGLALLLGFLGVFLPLLPTTPFVILAVFAFAKSAPSLARRIEASRTFGPAVSAWREEGAIAPRYKSLAIVMMVGALVLSIAVAVSTIVIVVQILCMSLAAAFILTRPHGKAAQAGQAEDDKAETPRSTSLQIDRVSERQRAAPPVHSFDGGSMSQTIPSQMTAVLLTGHGGLEVLDYRHDVATPRPGPDEVLIKVAAAGVNNTDINTRIGWYSKRVNEATESGGAEGFEKVDAEDASWSGVPLQFPRIQGADCCGHIVAVGQGVDRRRIGERVLVRNMLRTYVDYRPFACWTFGSECDGAFAQYAKAPARETHRVVCDWSDAELASIPCAYSTAENMLHRVGLGAERVLITGASGGVGSAAVQLAKRRGAEVIAVASAAKAAEVEALGADRVIDRNADLVAALGRDSVTVVIDLVAGPAWPGLLELLCRGGRYATAGAIGGPLVELDVRTLYLKDLSLIGCTFQDDIVFENLVGYIERGEIRPLVSQSFPLCAIAEAQEVFLAKRFTGKLVLLPPT